MQDVTRAIVGAVGAPMHHLRQEFSKVSDLRSGALQNSTAPASEGAGNQWTRKIIGTLAVTLLLMQARAASAPIPRIEVTPNPAFIDQSIRIGLRGFPARQSVTVRVRATNDVGQVWESHAVFLADRRGRVEVATQTPVSGTYQHPNAMGLFWSMSLPAGEKIVVRSALPTLKPLHCGIMAEVNGQVAATAKLERFFLPPGVQRVPLRDGKLRGTFFVPRGKGVHPGVIVLGGSEGGLYERDAAFLAAKGYAALALAYFAYEDLPPSLENIPLEYFEEGIHWLQSRKEVRKGALAVLGASRGGELALLLGATFPEIRAVVALAPSGIMWGGVSATDTAAWSYHHQPLPYRSNRQMTPEQMKQAEKLLQATPICTTPLFLMALENHPAVEKASIPVEKINGPVLLISGRSDSLWPATVFSDLVMERLQKSRHPFPDCHLAYEGAGHLFPIPFLPTTVNHICDPSGSIDMGLGGDPEQMAVASAAAWSRIVAFLRATFPK